MSGHPLARFPHLTKKQGHGEYSDRAKAIPRTNPGALYKPQTALVKTGKQSSRNGHITASNLPRGRWIHREKYVIFTHFHVCHHQLAYMCACI